MQVLHAREVGAPVGSAAATGKQVRKDLELNHNHPFAPTSAFNARSVDALNDDLASPRLSLPPLACQPPNHQALKPSALYAAMRTAAERRELDRAAKKHAGATFRDSVDKPAAMRLAAPSGAAAADHPTSEVASDGLSLATPSIAALAALRGQVFGHDASYMTPFGKRTMVYCDYAASGRLLEPMEAWLVRDVYPWFANVHSDVGECARITGKYVADARTAVVSFCRAPLDDYAVMLVGAGVTGTAAKLAHLLGIHPRVATGRGKFKRADALAPPTGERPVVIVSLMEHHSNVVFWREMDCDVLVRPRAPCFPQLADIALRAIPASSWSALMPGLSLLCLHRPHVSPEPYKSATGNSVSDTAARAYACSARGGRWSGGPRHA